MIELEVVGIEKGIATILIQKLRLELISAGLPPDILLICQKDKSAMSLGDILQIAWSIDIFAIADKTLEVALIVKSIHEFVRRNRVVLLFDHDGKKLEIPPSIISAKELQAVLEKALASDGRAT